MWKFVHEVCTINEHYEINFKTYVTHSNQYTFKITMLQWDLSSVLF